MNGWSGAQYSLFRFIVGFSISVRSLLIWEEARLSYALLSLLSFALAMLFAIGLYERFVIPLLALIIFLLQRADLFPTSLCVTIYVIFSIHLLLPRNPCFSLENIRRDYPNYSWRMPDRVFSLVWAALIIGYLMVGINKLTDTAWLDATFNEPVGHWSMASFEFLFAPLALNIELRPWLWGFMLLLHLDSSIALLHLLAFNPRWVKPAHTDEQAVVFYDGDCGFCHRWVRFLLSEDLNNTFQFSTRASTRFKEVLETLQLSDLPDSILVHTSKGALLSRSSAVIYILGRLGGIWRALSFILWCVPQPLRDVGYSACAAVRHKIFAKPPATCPMIPDELRIRFI